MFVLRLNDMRSAKFEHLTDICRADRKEDLIDFINKERVTSYQDAGPNHYSSNYVYSKGFRKGGPLEWFNSPREESYVEILSMSDYLALKEREYRNYIDSVPSATAVV